MISIKGQVLDTRLENVQDLENSNNDICVTRNINYSQKYESFSKDIDCQNTKHENGIICKTNNIKDTCAEIPVQDNDKSKKSEEIVILPDDNVNETNIFSKASYKRIQKKNCHL